MLLSYVTWLSVFVVHDFDMCFVVHDLAMCFYGISLVFAYLCHVFVLHLTCIFVHVGRVTRTCTYKGSNCTANSLSRYLSPYTRHSTSTSTLYIHTLHPDSTSTLYIHTVHPHCTSFVLMLCKFTTFGDFLVQLKFNVMWFGLVW